jgi:hypothetical protein
MRWIPHAAARAHHFIPEYSAPDSRLVEDAMASFAGLYPTGYEECLGIAEGIGISAKEYFEAAHSLLLRPVNCTVWAFRDEEGRPVIAKTDDLPQDEAGLNVFASVEPERGFAHRSLRFAGSIWTTAGVNEMGLVMAMTGIPGPIVPGSGYFSLDLLHRILPECADVREAVALVRSAPLAAYGFSLSLADDKGEMAMIEKSAIGTVELDPSPDYGFVHTNHIIDSAFAEANPPQAEPLHTNGVRRYRTATRLAHELPKTVAGAFSFLSDRSDDGAILQRGEDGFRTDYRVVLHRGEIWIGDDEHERINRSGRRATVSCQSEPDMSSLRFRRTERSS